MAQRGSIGADDITDPKTGKYYNGSNNGYAFVLLWDTPYKDLNNKFYIGERICGHSAIYGELAYMLLNRQHHAQFQDYNDCIESCGNCANIVHFTNLGGKFHRRNMKKNEPDSKMYRIGEIALKLQNRERDVNGRLFVNGTNVTGFDNYNIVAVHRPKQHFTIDLVKRLAQDINATMGLKPESLAFKLGVSTFIPYNDIIKRGYVYDTSNLSYNDESIPQKIKGSQKNIGYTPKQLQKLRDYQNSPDYNREGEYKYLRGDDKDYYGTKEWKRLKYANKPGCMTNAEWHFRTTMDETKNRKQTIRITKSKLRDIIREAIIQSLISDT